MTCSRAWIARIDADDIVVEDCFEHQLAYLRSDQDINAIVGYTSESEPTDDEQLRKVPINRDEVKEFAKDLCPTKHPTVMFRQESILAAGNHNPRQLMQNYELRMRTLSKGCVIKKAPQVLVYCSNEKEFYQRRNGLDYAFSQVKLQREFRRKDALSKRRCLANLLTRVRIRVLAVPILNQIYGRVTRPRHHKSLPLATG